MNKYQQVELAIKDAVSAVRWFIPVDTRNMQSNSFKIEPLGNMRWKAFIDQKIAPYAPYVNEKWVSPKWHGRQNPNEGFWKEVFIMLADMISAATNGKITWSIKI